MSRQVWATYSVTDHLHPRALVPDIMLFDRLVFPVPQLPDLRSGEVDATRRGPVTWSQNPVEWARWESQEWDPGAQEALLRILQPVVRKVPWDVPHQQAWRKEFSQKASENHLPDYAFVATRTVLTRDLPAYVTGVEAMGPAYRSLSEIEGELGVKSGNQMMLPGSSLSTVLGWEFLVPEDDRLSDVELLKETIAFVTDDAKFRLKRMNFWNWQHQYLKGDVTDRESIESAVDEMRELLEEQKAAASKMAMKKTVRYAFRVAPPTLALTGLFLGPVGAVAGTAGGAFLSFIEVVAEEWFSKKPQSNEPSPAAFVHDARRHFGWK